MIKFIIRKWHGGDHKAQAAIDIVGREQDVIIETPSGVMMDVIEQFLEEKIAVMVRPNFNPDHFGEHVHLLAVSSTNFGQR